MAQKTISESSQKSTICALTAIRLPLSTVHEPRTRFPLS